MERWPVAKEDPLQAWDQADLLLLEYAKQQPSECLLLLNDRFGALTTVLQGEEPVCWGDSYVSHLAAKHNLALNGEKSLHFVTGNEVPTGPFDTVLCRVPKSLEFWEWQLVQLRPRLSAGCRVVAGGMSKHLSSSALSILERTIGPATRHRAVGKARILSADFNSSLRPNPPTNTVIKELGFELENLPNVFARNRLDAGARLFLSTIQGGEGVKMLDLGCGNGVLGIALQRKSPGSALTFIDESYQAVESARRNFQRNCAGQAAFLVGDGLSEYQGPGFDFIAFNPPFHQGHQITDSVAWRMLLDARRHLTPGGELRLVGNRHLGYHAKLKRLFGNCGVVASDPKFVVLRAVETPRPR